MKKNFLAIASLLIAAMLLVVSCTQEVAPVDNGLVNVTLSTSISGKAITVSNLNSGVSSIALPEAISFIAYSYVFLASSNNC